LSIPILTTKLPRKSPLLFLKLPPQAERHGLPKEGKYHYITFNPIKNWRVPNDFNNSKSTRGDAY
jgi:hypothetical protein